MLNQSNKQIKVVLIDDHEIVRRGLSEYLADTGLVQICGTADGITGAITLLNKNKPDMAIIDIGLKDSSGIELIKAIKKRFPFVIPLVLSMHSESEIVVRAVKAGARAFILKSEPADQIIEAIQTVMRGGSFVSPCLRDHLLNQMITEKVEASSGISSLTDKEYSILVSIGQGLDRAEISRRLGISSSTIGTYRERIKQKLGCHSTGELMKIAVKVAERSGSNGCPK
jgi:DNA-binding NarL/FixJ family response regulator